MKLSQSLKRTARAGFSLAEIMVVIVIIGLLATLVVQKVVPMIFKAGTQKAKSDIRSISEAVKIYAIENNGRYPESLEVLVQEDEKGFTILEGESVPKDPWGFEYFYEPPVTGDNFIVGSYGKDGAAGGDGENRDITNVMIRNGEI